MAEPAYGPPPFDNPYQAPPPSYPTGVCDPATTPQPSYDDGDSTTVSKSKLVALAIFSVAAIGFGVGVAFGASVLAVPCFLCALVTLGILISLLPHNPNASSDGYIGVHTRDVHHHHHHNSGVGFGSERGRTNVRGGVAVVSDTPPTSSSSLSTAARVVGTPARTGGGAAWNSHGGNVSVPQH